MASRSIPRFLVMFMILSCGNCGAFARTKEATPNAFGANRHESEKAKRVCPRITCPHCYRVAGAARINANDSQLRIFFASIRVIRGLFEAKTTNRDPAVPQVGARSPRRAFHQRKS